MKYYLPDMVLSNAVIAGNAVSARSDESRGVAENVAASFEEARDVNSSIPAIQPCPALSFPAISAFPALPAF